MERKEWRMVEEIIRAFHVVIYNEESPFIDESDEWLFCLKFDPNTPQSSRIMSNMGRLSLPFLQMQFNSRMH
jgi:hypothetical protein